MNPPGRRKGEYWSAQHEATSMSGLGQLAAIAAFALASVAATSETIYRCGDEYSRESCAGAKSVPIESAPTARRRAEALQVVLREKRHADDMARERRREEAAFRPALAGSLGPARPPATAASSASTKKHARKRPRGAVLEDDRDFRAVVPFVKKAPS